MGKRLGIMLIMILNLIMLVHIGMPHHHHQHIPYFTSLSHSLSTEKEQNSCCSQQENQQPKAQKEGCCILDTSIIAFREQQNKIDCVVCLHCHPNHLVQAILWVVVSDSDIDRKADARIPSPPYINHYHSINASQSLGLRAPPDNV